MRQFRSFLAAKIWLSPAEAAPALGVQPYSFNVAVREDMDKYGVPIRFPFLVIKIGSRVKINREQYIYWLKGNHAENPFKPVVIGGEKDNIRTV